MPTNQGCHQQRRKDAGMPGFDTSTSVGEWVAEHPQTARVFEELQIDYCCGGDKPLAQACGAKGLDPDTIASRLSDAIAHTDDDSRRNWTQADLGELCDHIEATHHAFLRTELPRLAQLVDKVANVHGENHRELCDLRTVFTALRAELEPHMLKEEQILFPAIRQLENSTSPPQFPFGTVANPIHMMEHEHDNAGGALKRIRELTADFHVPEEACNTWSVMLDGLQNLEADLHQHIHKENNILFPRAQQLEA
jgi:regulator of cell morphogenesis and NO signaling